MQFINITKTNFPRVGIGRTWNFNTKIKFISMFYQRNQYLNSPPWVNMVRLNPGGLPTAALHGRPPPPYTSVTDNLNFLPKIWSKTVVHSLDPSKDTLKRPITTVLPSITNAHHDGGLPFPLSYTLANDNPPPPSIPTQRPRQNLRDRRLFWNWWTKWEAVKLADELEA